MEVKPKMKQKKGFKDFVPVVLSTRSRAETLTSMLREREGESWEFISMFSTHSYTP